jgi:heme/copper-type cytochrome/quinol oxidase subunit 4
MTTERLRRVSVALFVALGISIALHFILFMVVASGGNESSVVVRTAESMLTPGEAITERIAPGHSGAQIFYGFVVSIALYTVALWLPCALLSLRRKQV